MMDLEAQKETIQTESPCRTQQHLGSTTDPSGRQTPKPQHRQPFNQIWLTSHDNESSNEQALHSRHLVDLPAAR